MNKWKYGFGVMAAILLGVGVWKLLPEKIENDLLTPLGWEKWVEKSQKKMEVVGFLPSWMIGKTKMYGEELDQLIFSGIEVNVDGSLLWDLQSKKIDNGDYLKLKENIKKTGGKNLVSIKLFTDKDMDKLIADSTVRSRMISEVKDLVTAGKFDGVNVDFEYMSNPTRVLDADFGEMLLQMRDAGWGEVNIDVFANTIIKGDSDRLKKLTEKVDGVIVMAYDFHRPGSDYAGPVAPILADVGQRSIREIVDKLVGSGADPNKFIMAYPLYGYEWITVDDSFGSAQVNGGYGRTVFYTEGVGISGIKWDETSMSPWATWQEKIQKSKVKSLKVGKKIVKRREYYTVVEQHQAYFESERSLMAKMDMAASAKAGGVGYWALGYEGKNSNLLLDLGNYVKKAVVE